MRCILALTILLSMSGTAQTVRIKDFQLTTKGDTINRLDTDNRKHGRWISRVEDNMGEPGFQEEGNYVNNEKEGSWKVFSLMGDPIGDEFYRYGQKDGKQQYFDIHANLVREEQWKAITPDNMYDTVSVPDWKKDITGNTFKTAVVKLEGNALRHGTWLYYDEQSRLVRTDKYILDRLSESIVNTFDPKTAKLLAKEKTVYDIETGKVVAGAAYQRPKEVEKPKQVADFDKTKKGKSKKYKDGSVG